MKQRTGPLRKRKILKIYCSIDSPTQVFVLLLIRVIKLEVIEKHVGLVVLSRL